MQNKVESPPLNIIFQNLHFGNDWSITNGASLWNIFVFNNIAETLIRIENDSSLIPALCSEWSFSEDKKTLKFSVTEGYAFHDGNPIRPVDVLESLKRAFSSKDMHHCEIGTLIAEQNLDDIVRLNGDTIEIRLPSPLNGLDYNLAIPEMGITPQDYAQNKTPKESLCNLSGPYQVTDFTPKEMTLEKHSEGHPLLDRDSPDRVRIVEVPDGDDAIDYYNEHDNIILTGTGYAGASKALNLEGQKAISSPAFTEFFIPNIDSEKLDMKDKRRVVFSAIRNAFAEISIDERIAEKTDQVFTRDNTIRLEEGGLDSLYRKWSIDKPIKLSVLLFQYVQDTPILAPLAEGLKSLGIELEIIIPDDDIKAFQILKTRTFDLLYAYAGLTTLDPILELTMLSKVKVTNLSYKNPRLVAAMERAKIETDRDTYISLLKDIHAGLIEDYRILPLMHTKMVYAVKGSYRLKPLDRFDGELNLWDWRKV